MISGKEKEVEMESKPTTPRKMSPEIQRAIRWWMIQSALGVVGYGVVLFLTAGSLDWSWGWVLISIVFVFMAAHPVILIPINPELLAEREKGLSDPRIKSWDRWVAIFAAGVFPIASWIAAALDYRFQWSPPLAIGYHLSGGIIMTLGYALFLWALAANAFFSEGVRIQTERGHHAVTHGPYRFIRHPGYAGAIIAQAATPLLLGSNWAIIPAILSAGMYVVRTAMEDQTLIDELPGYEEFAQETRYRLIPGVW
jgi:protein-S-isoprenylcysteine O-methyltransferase Ste14